MRKKLFSVIDSLQEKYIEILKDVCEIESPTDYKPGVDAVGRYFIERAKELGFATEVFPQDVSGDIVCITMNSEVKQKPLFLSGHTDTVHPLGFVPKPIVRIEGDKLYGPGADDCKGGVVLALMAMEALSVVGYKKRPITLMLQSDEETNSVGSNKSTVNYMCQRAKDAELFLNLEPSNGLITLERKGILRYTLDIHGIAIHASQCFKTDCCASAVLEACRKIEELEKLKEEENVTCNCGLISGGTAVNTVPSNCRFVIDVRFSDEEGMRRAKEYVKNVAETSYVKGTVCDLTLESERVSMPYIKKNYDAYDFANSVFKKYGLSEMGYQKRCGGSDAADISAAGIPCMDAFGITGGNAHKIDEFAFLSSMPDFAKRISAIALEL